MYNGIQQLPKIAIFAASDVKASKCYVGHYGIISINRVESAQAPDIVISEIQSPQNFCLVGWLHFIFQLPGYHKYWRVYQSILLLQ
jgi:hypothetical protein